MCGAASLTVETRETLALTPILPASLGTRLLVDLERAARRLRPGETLRPGLRLARELHESVRDHLFFLGVPFLSLSIGMNRLRPRRPMSEGSL